MISERKCSFQKISSQHYAEYPLQQYALSASLTGISVSSQAVDHMGIITKSPKNDTSYRTIKLSDTVLDLLREYQLYWQERRIELDDYWQDNIQIILADKLSLQEKKSKGNKE